VIRCHHLLKTFTPAGERLDAADACRMAGFLLEAADGLDTYR
jgi:hypothetical protein